MIERVEHLEPKLRFHSLGDREVLVQARIPGCARAPCISVAADVSERTKGIRCEGVLVEVLDEHRALRLIAEVRIADQVGVLVASARSRVVDAARDSERKSALNIDDRGDVPAAQHQARCAIIETERQVEVCRPTIQPVIERFRHVYAIPFVGSRLHVVNHFRAN